MSDINEKFQLKTEVVLVNYYSNLKFRKWKGDFFEVYSSILVYDKNKELVKPYIGKYPLMDEKTAEKIVFEADRAYANGRGIWPTMTFSKRIGYFEKFLKEFNDVRDEVVKLMMWEIGKNYKDSCKEFDRTADYILKTIDALKQRVTFANDLVEREGVLGQIKRSPLGVVMCMGPYNYPLNESFTTLVPAMIMGNTIIFKPPKAGVLLHGKIIDLFFKIFPKGVFNVVYGEGQRVVKPIMESGKVRVLAFIGSSKVANIIQRYHPKPNRLKLVLGLEAKNAGIVLADADIDKTVDECVLGSLSFNGQRCTALKIIFVHEKVVDIFIKKFVRKVDTLKKGLPFDDAFITPVLEDSVDYYSKLVEDALLKGAKLVNNYNFNEGTFFSPKVISNVNKNMNIYHEEQFGPIVPIVSFRSINEPADYITNSPYGQQCAIFTNDERLTK
jgi:glyceraldehyde-3-phosphate dehydrogenase (NADP+)